MTDTPSARLYWRCRDCGAVEAVEPTGDGAEYELGDMEPCIDCGTGTCVVTPELTPCPRCGLGHERLVYCRGYWGPDDDQAYIVCDKCGDEGPRKDDDAAAIAAWNLRADQDGGRRG